MTTAVRQTVTSYCKQTGHTAPPLKRPFSETHITRNIRAQLSSAASDDPADKQESRSTSPSSSKDSNATEAEHSSTGSTLINHSEKGENGHRTSISYPDPESITADTLTANMFTVDNPPLDLLVRTSGVERLSDFMLWQCHENTSIVFLDCLWPEFDLWQVLPVLVEWQWQRKKLDEQERGRGRQKID